MSRRSRPILLGLVTLMGLTGCSTYVADNRPAWRAQAENACLAKGMVHETPYIRASRELSGPGICGMTHPFKVTALLDGTVTLNSTQTLDCPMIATLETWLKEVVQPAAMARFGEKVVRINSMGSYNCRGINNMSGANLSEHSFGNAIDIGGFVLESGRELNIMRGFNGAEPQEHAFLHEAHAGACGYFTTVLGPGYNIFHYNHFHVDLAMHGSNSRGMRRYCKPVPQTAQPEPPRKDDLPDPPAIEEELDIARAPIPAPSVGGSRFVASVPPEPPVTRARPVLMPGGFAPTDGNPPPRPRPAATSIARSEPPPQPLRSRPAPPPLISFASPEQDAEPEPPLRALPRSDGAPVSRRPLSAEPPPSASRPPTADAAPPADVGEDRGPGAAAEGDPAQAEVQPDPGPVEPPPRQTLRPMEGGPADWDATSSTRR